MSLQEKRKEILDFVARFGAKASKASQAQSRLKSLDKMETIELKALPVNASINLPAPIKTGRLILNLKNVDLGYGEKVILKNVNFMLEKGDHLAVVGLNGAGKSTLLKALADLLPPLHGEVEIGPLVTIGYFAQHVAESLTSTDTVLEAMSRDAHPDVTRQEALNLAGSLLFSGDAVKKKVSVLSGGEKARVALGRILLQRCPCLILDEPTNHLDFQTVEALTQALVKYQGTVVVVSHDRSFVRRIGTKILEIRKGSVELYPGSYDDYVWSVQQGVLSDRLHEDLPTRPSRTETPKENSSRENSSKENYKDKKKNLDRLLRQAERRIEEIDKLLPTQQTKLHHLSDKLASVVGLEAQKVIKEMGEIQAQIDSLEAEWLTMSEQREQSQAEIKDLGAR
jgi:ATP-binding cassette subfamily F protein 3